MPSPPIAPNVIRVQLKHTTGSDLDVLTRLFFGYTGGTPTDADCATLNTAVQAAWVADLPGLIATTTRFVESIVTDLGSDSGAYNIQSAGADGTRSGGELPAATAALINATIARRYRGGKPRTYWPFGTDSDVDTSQTWTSAFVTAVTTDYGNFLAALLAMTAGSISITGQVNVSYFKGFTSVQNPVTLRWRNVPTYRTGDATVDPITGWSLNPKFGSQRRRNQQRR